jgi:WD40 repeat protein
MVQCFSHPPMPAAKRADCRPPALVLLSLFCLLFSFLGTPSSKAQGTPTTQWIHGGHIAPLYPAALSSDGKTLVTTGGDGTIKIRRASDGTLLRTIYADSTDTFFALSPDGTKIVAGSFSSSPVRVYQVSDGALLQTWQYTNIISLAWSADGSQVALGLSNPNVIQLANASNGNPLAKLTGHTDLISDLAFSPDGSRLVSASNDKTVRVWDTVSGNLLQTFTDNTNFVGHAVFAPDNRTLAYFSTDNTIKLWDTTSGMALRSFSSGTITSLAFSPDGSTLASGSEASQVSLWNVADGSLLHSAPLGPTPTSISLVSYSPDATQLLAVGALSEFTYFSSSDLSVVRSLPSEHTASITGVGVTPDGAHVVSVAQNDAFLHVWNAVTGAPESLIPNIGSHTYTTMAISPDDMTFATGDTSSALRVWRIADGALLLDTNIGIQAPALAWSHDGKRLFYGASGGVISIRSAADGSLLGALSGGPVGVRSLVVSPDGSLLAAAGNDKVIKIWRLSDSTLVSTFTGHTDTILALAFSPDGTKLLSGSSDHTAILWNVADGAKLQIFSHNFEVVAVAFSSDGQSVATSQRTELRFYRVSDGSLFNDFTDGSQFIQPGTLVYSPNNASVFYGRNDATVAAIANPYLNPNLAEVTLNPSTVLGGLSTTGTLTLAHPAPAGGIAFSISTNSALATASTMGILIPEGATSATFTVSTTPVISNTGAVITAANNVYVTTATLKILAHLPSDFNNDGHSDLLFQSQTTNVIVVWFTSVLNILGGSTVSYLPQPDWQVVGAGDFNHDTNSDLVLQNRKTGKVVLWYLLGTTVAGGEEISFQPGPGYKVVGVGDFNGDGAPDLLFQQQGTGQLVIWYMTGATVTGGVSIPQIPAAGYSVVGTGDLNGDGKQDIVFQNQTTNQVMVWFMNGTQLTSQGTVSYLPPMPWKVHAVTDINGDGKADLVFQNTDTNQLVVWFMDGTTITGGDHMSLVPFADYKLAGPH